MKVLILEDDINKFAAIEKFLEDYEDINYTFKKSYHAGMQCLLNNSFDLLLLDMSMPIYDVDAQEPGGRPLALAGRDVLFQLRRRNIKVSVIVITQYEDFNGLSLQNLDRELRTDFPQHYLGCVYYNVTQDGWKEELSEVLKVFGMGR